MADPTQDCATDTVVAAKDAVVSPFYTDEITIDDQYFDMLSGGFFDFDLKFHPLTNKSLGSSRYVSPETKQQYEKKGHNNYKLLVDIENGLKPDYDHDFTGVVRRILKKGPYQQDQQALIREGREYAKQYFAVLVSKLAMDLNISASDPLSGCEGLHESVAKVLRKNAAVGVASSAEPNATTAPMVNPVAPALVQAAVLVTATLTPYRKPAYKYQHMDPLLKAEREATAHGSKLIARTSSEPVASTEPITRLTTPVSKREAKEPISSPSSSPSLNPLAQIFDSQSSPRLNTKKTHVPTREAICTEGLPDYIPPHMRPKEAKQVVHANFETVTFAKSHVTSEGHKPLAAIPSALPFHPPAPSAGVRTSQWSKEFVQELKICDEQQGLAQSKTCDSGSSSSDKSFKFIGKQAAFLKTRSEANLPRRQTFKYETSNQKEYLAAACSLNNGNAQVSSKMETSADTSLIPITTQPITFKQIVSATPTLSSTDVQSAAPTKMKRLLPPITLSLRGTLPKNISETKENCSEIVSLLVTGEAISKGKASISATTAQQAKSASDHTAPFGKKIPLKYLPHEAHLEPGWTNRAKSSALTGSTSKVIEFEMSGKETSQVKEIPTFKFQTTEAHCTPGWILPSIPSSSAISSSEVIETAKPRVETAICESIVPVDLLPHDAHFSPSWVPPSMSSSSSSSLSGAAESATPANKCSFPYLPPHLRTRDYRGPHMKPIASGVPSQSSSSTCLSSGGARNANTSPLEQPIASANPATTQWQGRPTTPTPKKSGSLDSASSLFRPTTAPYCRLGGKFATGHVSMKPAAASPAQPPELYNPLPRSKTQRSPPGYDASRAGRWAQVTLWQNISNDTEASMAEHKQGPSIGKKVVRKPTYNEPEVDGFENFGQCSPQPAELVQTYTDNLVCNSKSTSNAKAMGITQDETILKTKPSGFLEAKTTTNHPSTVSAKDTVQHTNFITSPNLQNSMPVIARNPTVASINASGNTGGHVDSNYQSLTQDVLAVASGFTHRSSLESFAFKISDSGIEVPQPIYTGGLRKDAPCSEEPNIAPLKPMEVDSSDSSTLDSSQPWEGIRARQGKRTAEKLSDRKHEMMPTPEDCDRPLFNTSSIRNSYIMKWRLEHPVAGKVEMNCADFTPLAKSLENTQFFEPPLLGPVIPDLANSENVGKQKKQTSETEVTRKLQRQARGRKVREQLAAGQAMRDREMATQVPEPDRFAPTIDIHLRPANMRDANQMVAIYNHYVENTYIPEDQEPINAQAFSLLIETCQREMLPLIVAVAGKAPESRNVRGRAANSQKSLPPVDEQIVGFATAESFNKGWGGCRRGRSRATAYLTLYVSPNFVRKGVGRNLMDRLLVTIRSTYSFRNACKWINPYNDSTYHPGGAGNWHQLVVKLPVLKKEDPNFGWVKTFLAKFHILYEHTQRSSFKLRPSKPMNITTNGVVLRLN